MTAPQAEEGPLQEPVDVVVIMGSENDDRYLQESKALEIFDAVGVAYDVSVISAHRNPDELDNHCQRMASDARAVVFVAIAGMSAALPGDMAAVLLKYGMPRCVIGIPVPSEGYPDAHDAFLAMFRMPPGTPVAVCGSGTAGFRNAFQMACTIVAIGNESIARNLNDYLARTKKAPKYRKYASKRRIEDGTPT